MQSVLLVEAEIPLMQRMAWILLEAGFVTARVESASDVADTLSKYVPDVLVINNDMPEPRKRGCIDDFRSLVPSLRVLDIHSAGLAGAHTHVTGADDVLHMPFDAEDLVQKISTLAATGD